MSKKIGFSPVQNTSDDFFFAIEDFELSSWLNETKFFLVVSTSINLGQNINKAQSACGEMAVGGNLAP